MAGLGGSSGHGVVLPVPASSARGARVLLSRRGCCFLLAVVVLGVVLVVLMVA